MFIWGAENENHNLKKNYLLKKLYADDRSCLFHLCQFHLLKVSLLQLGKILSTLVLGCAYTSMLQYFVNIVNFISITELESIYAKG